MSLIRFNNASFGYNQPLFTNLNLSINEHDRIGIVGNNGCGKSTLLACMSGHLEVQEGIAMRSKGARFAFVTQDVPKEYAPIKFIDLLHEALPVLEKEEMAWCVDLTLDTLKVPQAMRHKTIETLSGGWQRLAIIAKAVMSQPDVLLLDEPTNHLDVEKILILEQWLNGQLYNIPLVTISHDRRFLANCTNKTLFFRGTNVHEYNYSYEQASQLLQKDEKTAQDKRVKEVKEANRLRQSAHELRQIGVNNYSSAALKKSIQIAKRAEKLETQFTNVHVEKPRALQLSYSESHAKKIIEITKTMIKAPNGEDLFYIEHFEILQHDKIIIFGQNGSGKSQLLKYLYQLSCDKPHNDLVKVNMSASFKPTMIDQHLMHMPSKVSVNQYLSDLLTFENQKIIKFLVNAGFPLSKHGVAIGSLSQGERARLAFLLVYLLEPNFYVLDEPTNHLDITGQEQLEAEILKKEATFVVVSHDRDFTNNVGSKFYIIQNKSLVQINSAEVYYRGLIE